MSKTIKQPPRAPRAVPAPTSTPKQARARVEKVIDASSEATSVKRDAKKRLRPAIGIYTKRSAKDLPVGASKFGGLPDLNGPWPLAGPFRMTFVAQFRMEDLAVFDVDKVLPRRGLLSFFEHDWLPKGANEPQVYSMHEVLFTEDTRSLKRAEPTKDKRLAGPPWLTSSLAFHVTFEIDDPRFPIGPPAPSQLLGYDHDYGYGPPTPPGTRPLFRCGSDKQSMMNYGDAQDIAFRLSDEDLAAHRFDRTTLWMPLG